MEYELRKDILRHVKVLREMGDGARLYDSHNTISIAKGQKVITWWKTDKDSQKVKQETLRLAEQFAEISRKPEEFIPEKMTPGRLIRAFLEHVIKLKLEGKAKIYGERYYYLVKERQELLREDDLDEVISRDEIYDFTALPLRDNVSHWHYLYLNKNPSGYAIELDIKAAYFTSLLQEKTLIWYDPGKGGGKPHWLNDGGAMDRLREYAPLLPKWFRLQMLGIIGSHELKYETYNYGNGGKRTQAHIDKGGIKYGAAFNVVHKAIYRVYDVMNEIAELVKDDLIRSHTDCFTVKTSMTRRTEAEMLSALAARGFELSCKGIGWAHFWDIDKGVLGRGKPKGRPEEIEDLVRKNNIIINYCPIELFDRWSHWLPPIPSWMKKMGSDKFDFVPTKLVTKYSPERLQGYWRVKVNGEWISKMPDELPQPVGIDLSNNSELYQQA